MKKRFLYNRVIRAIIYVLLLEAIIFYPVFFVFLGIPIKHRFVEEYKFKVVEPSQIKLAVILPSDGPYQEISDIVYDWDGSTELIDYGTAQVLRISGDVENSVRIKVKFTAKMKTGRINWDEKILENHIQDENDIESTDRLIMNKANSITDGKSTKDVREIYNFVNEHIKWPTGDRISYGEVKQSALTALETGEGVCGEFANLMTALCRAKEIPAKSVSGLNIPFLPMSKKSNWSHQAGAHAWVEFYSDGKWHFADPSRGGSRNYNNVDGLHLSYGEKEHIKKVFDESVEWAGTDFNIIGAMNNPLHFVAAASSENTAISPVGYIDIKNRYILFFIVVIIIAVIEGMIKRKLRHQKSLVEKPV